MVSSIIGVSRSDCQTGQFKKVKLKPSLPAGAGALAELGIFVRKRKTRITRLTF